MSAVQHQHTTATRPWGFRQLQRTVSAAAPLPPGNINNVSLPLHASVKKKSAKSKTCKGAETRFTWGKPGVRLRERARSKRDLEKFGCSPVPQVCNSPSRGELQRSCISPRLVQHHPVKPHERLVEETCLPQEWRGSCTHLPVPDSGRGSAPRGSPACHPHRGVSAPYLPCPRRTDHTARVSASIFCSPWRFSSSWTWATFCRIAISGPPPYRVLK